jgi:hypothetical protein
VGAGEGAKRRGSEAKGEAVMKGCRGGEDGEAGGREGRMSAKPKSSPSRKNSNYIETGAR